MNRTMLHKMLDYHAREVDRLKAVTINCDSCQHWGQCSRVPKGCRLADEVPPADVQATGCEQWEWDPMPF